MRKFLRNFFWSHGAPLGYLGSLSQKGHPEIFSKWVLINLSNPLRHPAPLVDPLLTKNLDTARPWCVGICLQSFLSGEKSNQFHQILWSCFPVFIMAINVIRNNWNQFLFTSKPHIAKDFWLTELPRFVV